jgi:predicted MFS family arabinose efflux permease
MNEGHLGPAAGRGVGAILFLCLFAAQSGLIALSPVLVEVGDDFGVSTAAAGQLRTVSGLAAGVTALALPLVARLIGLRRLLVGSGVLLAFASLASAAAPSFVLLALAQVPVGVAVAALVTAATAAAADWAAPSRRAHVLAWTLIGSPAAWIVGMPAIGLLGDASWRYAWLALPLPAALAAALAAARSPCSGSASTSPAGVRVALADPPVRRWALGELGANSAWIGVLVYAGALFRESYDSSPAATGAILTVTAVAFLAGNLAFRRSAEGDPRRLLIRIAIAMAVLVALLGSVRPTPAVSAFLLASMAFLGGGRTLLGNVFGLRAAPEQRVAAMAARAAANQFGYFVGSAAGGVALAVWGYAGLGVTLGLLFAVAAAALVELTPQRRTRATFAARRRRAAAPARAR